MAVPWIESISVSLQGRGGIAAVNKARKIITVCCTRKPFAYKRAAADVYNNNDGDVFTRCDIEPDAVQFSLLDTSTAPGVEMKALSQAKKQ